MTSVKPVWKASVQSVATLVLAALFACCLAPAFAWAEGEAYPDESMTESPAAQQVADTQIAFEQVQADASLLPQDPDELFAGYVQQRMDAALPGHGSSSSSSLGAQGLPDDNVLSDNEKALLAKLKTLVADVAADPLNKQPDFVIEFSEVGFRDDLKGDDLGVNQLFVDYSDDQGVPRVKLSDEAWDAVYEKLSLNFEKVLNALLVECPYELYWYDKTSGSSLGIGYTISTLNGVAQDVTINGPLHFSMVMLANPADSARVDTAVKKAQEIVNDNASKPVFDRLDAYRQAICDLVSYNDEAASGNAGSYGDPWQLVSVFDSDPSTNVVCEGYSKAFQYLCDLSNLPNVNCYTVTGAMVGGTGSGPHMWNIVHMDNGKNYLVDVTNCDGDAIAGYTVGYPDLLFMAYGPEGSVGEGYDFGLGTSNIFYTYDPATRSVLRDGQLEISATKYEGNSLAKAKLSVTGSYVYNGQPQVPAPGNVKVTLGDATLEYGTDYTFAATDVTNNTDAGNATLTVTGAGAYTGETSTTFTIAKRAVTKVVLDVSGPLVYSGSAYEPAITLVEANVEANDMALASTDYDVAYANNVNAGKAKATVTGKGNFTGSASAEFVIDPLAITSAQLASAGPFAYSGNPITPELVVKADTMTLPESGYYVSYDDNVNAGSVLATVVGKGNFTGAKTVGFTIDATSIEGAALVLSKSSFTYNGRVQKPTAKTAGSVSLNAGGYRLVYSNPNSTNAGTYTVAVEASGPNCTGTSAKATYTIARAANPLAVKAVAKSLKAKKVKKKSKVISGALKVTGAKGPLSYKRLKGSKKLKVNAKTGKITVKKKAKKGLHTIVVQVNARGDTNHLSASKTVTVNIKVK